ncbi:hypothetical protein HNQ76_001940 [Thermosulfuriphilus ammonigenes]|nr:hypothetical protein [Thermosulfuriphilus ammonigenes]
MQREDTEYPFHRSSYARKDPVPFLLPTREGRTPTGFGQYATKFALLTVLLPNVVIGFVCKDGLLVSLKQLIEDLRVMDVGWRTDKLGHKITFGINGNMIFVAIDHFTYGGLGNNILNLFKRSSVNER